MALADPKSARAPHKLFAMIGRKSQKSRTKSSQNEAENYQEVALKKIENNQYFLFKRHLVLFLS